MAIRPAGVVFVNNDLTTSVRDALVRQLHIDEVIDGYVFDDRVTADPDYVSTVKLANLRIMVVRSFEELTNRSLADVVIFVTHGLAYVLNNKFGPPGITTQVCRVTWGKLCVFET
jgi:hypothetical protein